MSRFPGQAMPNMNNNSVERLPAGKAGIACSVEWPEKKNCHFDSERSKLVKCFCYSRESGKPGRGNFIKSNKLNAKRYSLSAQRGFTPLKTGVRREKLMRSLTGFTLVEVLIVTVILSVISLAIFSTFSNGLKIYNRINSEVTLEDLIIFFDRLGQDLRNSLNYSTVNFTGKDEELEFAGIVNSPRMQKRTVGKIKYVFDPSAEKLSRFTGDYSSVYNQEWLGSRQTLEKIKSCVFSYYYYDNQTKEFSWLPEWDKAGVPVALRLELGLKDNPEDKFIRTFNIPVGNYVRNDTKKEE